MKASQSQSFLSGMRPVEPQKAGILPSQDIVELINNGKICSSEAIAECQIQPASIDLRLGRVAYRVEASFLPNRAPISAKIRSLKLEEVDLTRPAVLKTGSVYIIPLIETLALPKDMSGKANPKSTTGRLDIFTRLMTDGGTEFEQIPNGYKGDLYVEVVPRTFSVVVMVGTKLNQLRFWRGSAQRDDDFLSRLDRTRSLVYYESPTDGVEFPGNGSRVVAMPARIGGGLQLKVDLCGPDRECIVAFRAKRRTPPIDLGAVGAYDPSDYWEFITRLKHRRIVLQPGDFYLLASKERLAVPPDHAAEMEQYDPSLGEFSVHYAGFFDPGFGFGGEGEIKGTRAVLEVRAHEVPILLEDSQTVGRVNYYRMTTVPEKLYGQTIGSSYQGQGLALSKQFKTPTIASAKIA